MPIGEIAMCRVLSGRLPPVTYPAALQRSAWRRWRWNAAFSLLQAEQYAARAESTLAAGMTARATLQTAHAVLAARGEWALNEKRLVTAAGLEAADAIIGSLRARPVAAVEELRRLLDPPRLDEVDARAAPDRVLAGRPARTVRRTSARPGAFGSPTASDSTNTTTTIHPEDDDEVVVVPRPVLGWVSGTADPTR